MKPAAHPVLERFSPMQRGLHWLMAAAVLAMLFIGVGMVTTVAPRYAVLVAIHRPLGIAILVLTIARLALRQRKGAPALPADLPSWQKAAARASHVLLYSLMLAMPLLGWAMLSAGGYPVVLYGGLHLPRIMPHEPGLYAVLHELHVGLAFLLFAVILVHLSAAVFHGLVRRDGVFSSMAPWCLHRADGFRHGVRL
jgi:cytochrome b561